MRGGSRGFTIFDVYGGLVYESGNLLEQLVTQIGKLPHLQGLEGNYVHACSPNSRNSTRRLFFSGHYPDERSENKGNEPENIYYAEFDGEKLLFVSSERSNVVFVFDVSDVKEPELKQILPAGVGPEGTVAIPSRGLLLVSSEVDDRGDKIRGSISIYSKDFKEKEVVYPFIESELRADGTPIPFGALSALATIKCDASDSRRGIRGLKELRRLNGKNGGGSKGKGKDGGGSKGKGKGKCNKDTFYTVEDSFYKSNRILAIDAGEEPAIVFDELPITDKNGIFAAALAASPWPGLTTELINPDGTVNIDPEGIDTSKDGGFWLVHEGRGTTGDAGRPFESPNVLFKLDENAIIEQVILPPQGIIDNQVRFGYEGVAEAGDMVVVAFQRALQGEPNPRLGVWSPTGGWTYYYYPLDTPTSQNGGWVGLSDIVYAGDGEFYIVERDNQGGPDAAIKKIYSVTITGPGAPYETSPGVVAVPPTLTKVLVYDLFDDLKAATNGQVLEKIEGITLDSKGNIWINNDNDGVVRVFM